jgi:hypothetical protein
VSSRLKVVSYVLVMVALLLGVRLFAQRPESTEREIGAWYQHPQGIYRVPLAKDWQVLRGVRGKVKDEQFDTLVDPTRQYSILCWRSSEKVSDEMTALTKYREEKLAELTSEKNVHAAGMSINRVPMMRITYQTSADSMVSRISAVKNGQRIVINTVSPLGPASGQLPKLIDDLIAGIQFQDRGVTIDPPPAMTQQPPIQDLSVSRPTIYPPTSVLESQKATVSSAGGSLTLQGGMRLVVPPDAVASETEIMVERLMPEVFNGDKQSKYVVLNCTASIPKFDRPVELRVPVGLRIPENAPPPLVGTLNEETGLLELCPTRFEVMGAGVELVIKMDHFCMVVLPSVDELIDWLDPLPSSAEPIETGIYKQGSSPFCWAMMMHTQARAYGVKKQNPYRILGDIGLDFVGSVGIRWRPSIGNWFQTRTKQQPMRLFWGVSYLRSSDDADASLASLKHYIRHEVGKERRPVFLSSSSLEHAWLVVGYDDQDNFIVHDPRSTPDFPHKADDIGYFTTSASNLGLRGESDSYHVTISIPDSLNPQRSLATLNIPHRGIWFNNPSVQNTFVFTWTHSTPEGYEWRQARQVQMKGEVYDSPLPPTVEELQLGSDGRLGTGLEVINGSRTETKRLTVEVEIGKEGREEGGEALHKEQTELLTVEPNRRMMVNLTIPVKKFRLPEDTNLTKYRFLATLREGGVAVDQASFAFEIGPGQWFEMEEITPAQKKQSPLFAQMMIPERIFWCEPTKPNATETQLTLHYTRGVEGRPPLSAGNHPGVSPKITLRALREGDEYVVRGPALDEIARQAEFCWRYNISMFAAEVAKLNAQTLNAHAIGDTERHSQIAAEFDAKRRAAENIKVAVENIEFRLRSDGGRLRLTVRGKAAEIPPDEAPIVSEAGVEGNTPQLTFPEQGILEVVGNAEKK